MSPLMHAMPFTMMSMNQYGQLIVSRSPADISQLDLGHRRIPHSRRHPLPDG